MFSQNKVFATHLSDLLRVYAREECTFVFTYTRMIRTHVALPRQNNARVFKKRYPPTLLPPLLILRIYVRTIWPVSEINVKLREVKDHIYDIVAS